MGFLDTIVGGSSSKAKPVQDPLLAPLKSDLVTILQQLIGASGQGPSPASTSGVSTLLGFLTGQLQNPQDPFFQTTGQPLNESPQELDPLAQLQMERMQRREERRAKFQDMLQQFMGAGQNRFRGGESNGS